MINGKLLAFSETGTEGIIWCLEDDKNQGHESRHKIEDGDYLKVKNNDGTTLWEGTIKFEYERNYMPYPTNPKCGQQEVFGYWVHGFQETLAPEIWARMFFEIKNATLTKKTQN